MSETPDAPRAKLIDAVRQNAGLTVAAGVILVIAGILAILSPFVAGLSITIMVGVLLAISGIGQCFLAFRAGAFGRGLMLFAAGLLMTVAGFYMMSQPVSGLAALTLVLVAFLIATGTAEIIVAFQLKPADGWGIELFSGIVTLVLGILLWQQFPLSGAWAIGILLGIKMVFSGWAFIFVGRGAKKLAKQAGSA
jgi:uncharacterized membrane protein HdeD (DUF308 family)